jgi:hypothetical protein
LDVRLYVGQPKRLKYSPEVIHFDDTVSTHIDGAQKGDIFVHDLFPQFQHHDRDDNSEHVIAERFQPTFAHTFSPVIFLDYTGN